MRISCFSLPFILAPLLSAAPLTDTGIIGFSNIQASASTSFSADYGSFSTFGFSAATFSDSPYGIDVMLPLGPGGYLIGNPTRQSISAQTSIDFDAQGYRITRIQLSGTAVDDGTGAGEAFGISGPCVLSISGSASSGTRSCTLPDGGLSSGTVTAWLRMYSDASVWHRNTATIANPGVMLTMIHNPEPDPMILLGLGLIGLWAVSKKFSKT